MNILKGLRVYYDLESQNGAISAGGDVTSAANSEPSKLEGKEVSQGQPEIQKNQPAWMEQLPKELQYDERLKSFSSIGELATAFLGDEKKGSFLEQISSNVDQKQWEEFKKNLLDEKSSEQEKKSIDEYINFVKDAKLNTTQAKNLLDATRNLREVQEKKSRQQEEMAPKRCEEFLKKAWGENYDANFKNAKKGYNNLFKGEDDQLAKSFKSSKYVNDPLIMELLNRVGSLVGEPSMAFDGRSVHSQGDNDWGIPSKFYH